MTAIGLAVLPNQIGLAADGRTVPPADAAGWPADVDRTVKVLPVFDRYAVAFGGVDHLPDPGRDAVDSDGAPWWTSLGLSTNAERLRFWEREQAAVPDDPEDLADRLCALYAPPLIEAAQAAAPDADEETLGWQWSIRLYVAGWSPRRDRGEVWQAAIRVGRPEEHPGQLGAYVGIRELATTDEALAGVVEDWDSAADPSIMAGLDGLNAPTAARELVGRAVSAQERRGAVVSGGRVLTVALVPGAAAYVDG